MCVRKEKVNGLVGWYRMGNDTGRMSYLASPDGTQTNNQTMKNQAWPKYSVKHFMRAPGPIRQDFASSHGVRTVTVTGSEYTTNEIASSGFPSGAPTTETEIEISTLSLVTASFSGFTGTSCGIIPDSALTGAFKYPSYITGSHYNQTADGAYQELVLLLGTITIQLFFHKNKLLYKTQGLVINYILM